MAAAPTEHAEQVSLCGWLDAKHPDLDYWATPNGGNRNIVTAAKMKAEGQKAGIPDLFFPELRLFVEMKRTKGGSVSKEQKHWIERLTKHGYKVVVCKGAAEAVKAIEEALNAHSIKA